MTVVEEQAECPSLSLPDAPAFGVGNYGAYGPTLFLRGADDDWYALGAVTLDGDAFSGRLSEVSGAYEQYYMSYEYVEYTDVEGVAYR